MYLCENGQFHMNRWTNCQIEFKYTFIGRHPEWPQRHMFGSAGSGGGWIGLLISISQQSGTKTGLHGSQGGGLQTG